MSGLKKDTGRQLLGFLSKKIETKTTYINKIRNSGKILLDAIVEIF